jgi:hypothetical protein
MRRPKHLIVLSFGLSALLRLRPDATWTDRPVGSTVGMRPGLKGSVNPVRACFRHAVSPLMLPG